MPKTVSTTKRGQDVLLDAFLNKGTAFTAEERQQLHLDGLMPPAVSSEEDQIKRASAAVKHLEDDLDRYVALLALQDRNIHLFYNVLMHNMGDMMPIVYTPTVGLACQQYSKVFQRANGLWINPTMQGRIQQVLADAVGEQDIELIVVTDNESILGIGDQGAGGMAISVGKLALYVAGAGIHPQKTLPISLDVGTNNQSLIDDPLYLGYRHPRLTGAAYDDFVEEFVSAVQVVCPNTLLQWEDFRKDNALNLLNRYKDRCLSFNDDIQGTGAVAMAGLFSALRITESNITDHRILIHGAGAAGMGIADQAQAALVGEGLDPQAAQQQIAVLDSRGLLVDDVEIRDAYKAKMAWPAAFAESLGLTQDARHLHDVVAAFKPTIIIGSSGQARAFDQALVDTMSSYCERPIIMPFSNPTALAEALPSDLLQWTDGRALVATGSPFEPVQLNGKTHRIGQGNNVFIFPGLGLGALVAETTTVTDAMVTAASRACAEAVSDAELAEGMLYPDIARLREVSIQVAAAVAQAAGKDISTDDIAKRMWSPEYPAITAV